MSEAMYPPAWDEIEPGIWITSHADYALYIQTGKKMVEYLLSFSGDESDTQFDQEYWQKRFIEAMNFHDMYFAVGGGNAVLRQPDGSTTPFDPWTPCQEMYDRFGAEYLDA